MRILVLGAGAVGGYFGGRLAKDGADVTFLLRPARRAKVDAEGITVTSDHFEDFHATPKTIGPDEIDAPFDLILLSCKSYDLDAAMDAIAPAMGPGSVVLPMLNGLRQLEVLADRFGPDAVLGGTVYIGAALNAETGHIHHFGNFHRILFGELPGHPSPHAEAFAALDAQTAFTIEKSDNILEPMWDKFVMQATLSCANLITGGTVGDILEGEHGEAFLLSALAEAQSVSKALDHPITQKTVELYTKMFTERGSKFATSTLRDVQAGRRTEGAHIVGDLVRRAEEIGAAAPILTAGRARLETYEAERAKKAGA